ncbi:hypothetical protein EVA_05466 [gut metagenome]|uniref:Uncharacterized protein n=1 Tax=gut metagenome TaxID=749906 RepID=J9GUE3_9ZZZZ
MSERMEGMTIFLWKEERMASIVMLLSKKAPISSAVSLAAAGRERAD